MRFLTGRLTKCQLIRPFSANAGFNLFDDEVDDRRQNTYVDPSKYIVDIREYDVPYHVRVSIDKGRV